MSPPTAVHARPVATPGSPTRSATSLTNFFGPRTSSTTAPVDDLVVLGLALGDLHRDRATHAADLALEVTHAGLAGVAVDDLEDRLVGDLGAALGQTVILELLGHEELAGDLLLLLPGVAGQLDDLETIAQRPRDRIELVRGRDEHHLATGRT